MKFNTSYGRHVDAKDYTSIFECTFGAGNDRSRGTQIERLPEAKDLGMFEDLAYFQNKLYKSYGIPGDYRIAEAQLDALKEAAITVHNTTPRFRVLITKEQMDEFSYDRAMKVVGVF